MPPTENATPVVGAITLSNPQQIGWSVSNADQSWTGHGLEDFMRCFGTAALAKPATLSISYLFELTLNEE